MGSEWGGGGTPGNGDGCGCFVVIVLGGLLTGAATVVPTLLWWV